MKQIERNMQRDVDADRFASVKAIQKSGLQHPGIKRYKIGNQDTAEIQRMKRTQASQFTDRRRKTDAKLKDVAAQKTEVVKLQKTLFDATNDEASQQRARESRERDEKRAKWKGMQGKSKVKEDDQQSYATMGKKPLGHALVNHFIEDVMVENGDISEADLKIREIARNLKIPLPDVEKVKKVFDKYDEDGSGQMEKEEFKLMMTDLICVGKLKGLQVPNGLLEDQWLSVDHDGSGEVDFDEFCEWYFFAYLPMMEKMEARGAVHKAMAKKGN